MTKVIIIDVDLGEIDKIISEDVAELHGDSKKQLEAAIEERKSVEKVRIDREEKKKTEDEALSNVMQQAYDKLLENIDDGVPTQEILNIVQPTVTNASAFTTRMKTILKNNGNPYAIKRKTKNKIPRYIFIPVNETS